MKNHEPRGNAVRAGGARDGDSPEPLDFVSLPRRRARRNDLGGETGPGSSAGSWETGLLGVGRRGRFPASLVGIPPHQIRYRRARIQSDGPLSSDSSKPSRR